MRVFALSDIHVDYDVNARWVHALPQGEYRDDVLVLAGDVSDSLDRLARCLDALVRRFRRVFFVPGNHELWVVRDPGVPDSLEKFERVQATARRCGAATTTEVLDGVALVPLLGWYDLSFGTVTPELMASWMDFRACRWPAGWTLHDVADHFAARNEPVRPAGAHTVISYSHFLPRIDLMPDFIGPPHRRIYPVLGGALLGEQLRALAPDLHIYGHSHVNQSTVLDGIAFINNAFAYPHERHIAAKALRCVYGAPRPRHREPDRIPA